LLQNSSYLSQNPKSSHIEDYNQEL